MLEHMLNLQFLAAHGGLNLDILSETRSLKIAQYFGEFERLSLRKTSKELLLLSV
jgi:hypothetical protein